MTHSALTNQIRLSPQSSDRNGTTIDTYLIHHQAGTNDDAVIDMMVNRTRQVSSNYTISNEGRITLVVDEDLRAWTSGSTRDGGKGAAWDRRSITVEIENESGAPDWPISAAATDAAARLLNDLRARYSIRTVIGHRDLWLQHRASYATFCPGPHPVEAITQRAAELLGEPAGATPTPGAAPAPAPVPAPAATTSVASGVDFGGFAGKNAWRGLQTWLAREWGYTGIIDGIPGSLTWTALQSFLRTHWGYQGAIDGLPGRLSWTAAQRWLQASHGYLGALDGLFGPRTSVALARAARGVRNAPAQVLPRTGIDGHAGPTTWRRAQTWLARDWGYVGGIDGIPGHGSWSAMQRFLARNWKYTGPIDGDPGTGTNKAFQRWLKASWGYSGPIDGIPGNGTWSAFQRFVNSV
jgi:peptidoglycan hydrolase-like protein with peptidoglycan-binding domain